MINSELVVQASLQRTNLMFKDNRDIIPQWNRKRRSAASSEVIPKEARAESNGSALACAAQSVQDGQLVVAQLAAHTSVPSNAPAASSSRALTTFGTHAARAPPLPTPTWHAPWELDTVVSGHLGWVRCLAMDPSNDFFATGSADRTIKIWDLAKCCAGAEDGLKLTLTGHVHTVRGLAFSPRHPYLFSAGEDKQVKCWDLEHNKVVRHYHGHLSGVFCLALHPTLDVLITGGRDSVARVWDMRTKSQVQVLCGHEDTVASLLTHTADPQVVTGSHDSTVKLWDLAKAQAISTLTQHKKSVRSLVASKKEFVFLSGGADNIKKWRTRDGTFIQNFSGQHTSINALALNEEGVLASCGDDGSLRIWDYTTGHCFQQSRSVVQPGSLDAEAGIYAAAFDLSGSRLLTCEADKSIKIWKENVSATEDSHPVDMQAYTKQVRGAKRY